MYDVARRIARELRREDGAGARKGGSAPRVLVVLRMHVEASSLRTAGALDRVATVARSLRPGELLAVRLRAEPAQTAAWLRLACGDVRVETCSFGSDDHEILIWRPARPSRETCLAGRRTLDDRALLAPLSIVAPMLAAARLGPGESLLHRSERGPPLLLVDLLAGRAVFEEGRGAEGQVLSRLVRRPVEENDRLLPARPARRGADDRLSQARPRTRAPVSSQAPAVPPSASSTRPREWASDVRTNDRRWDMIRRGNGCTRAEDALAPRAARARSRAGDYAREADEDFGRAADEGYPLARREEGEEGNVDRERSSDGLRR